MSVRSRAGPHSDSESRALVARLRQLRREMVEYAATAELDSFGDRRASARNLLHYLALRRSDLRRVQLQLADRGLSSLGRAEGHVLYNLDAVLSHLGGAPLPGPAGSDGAPVTPLEGREQLERATRRLLGPLPKSRTTRIMVTLPSEAATDARLVRQLLRAGTDAVRINCAHDTERDWARMIRNVRSVARALHRPCRVEMDLGGPKLRTGPLPAGPAVVKIRPDRDPYGRVLRAGRVWLVPADRPGGASSGFGEALPVDRAWLERVRVPGEIRLTDARGAARRVRLLRRSGGSVAAEVAKSVYFREGVRLVGRGRDGHRAVGAVGRLDAAEPSLNLQVGDRLLLASDPNAGVNARPTPGDSRMPVVGCTLPEALATVRPGHRIWFDDGKIGARAVRVNRRGVIVRIVHTAPGGSRLRPDRGINLPDTQTNISPITEEDRRHLRFVAKNADVVGLSFVRAPGDLVQLRALLSELGRPRQAVILKVETRGGFEVLPALLLEALRSPPTGVMIARGDLAVELGYERLAEVQEEILWLCEAAHVPVVWATEVLAGLAKTGLPTRAEVTDAAMGERAECVMLNKGPHIVEAVRALDNILRRMQAHQEKKMARLRHLAVADRFLRRSRAATRTAEAGGRVRIPPGRAGSEPGSGRSAGSHRVT